MSFSLRSKLSRSVRLFSATFAAAGVGQQGDFTGRLRLKGHRHWTAHEVMEGISTYFPSLDAARVDVLCL